MIPRIASLLVTTRAPTFFAHNQSAALLMLTPGAIVATSVPFRSKMFSTFMTIPLCIPAEVGCRSQLLTAIILRLSRQDYADLQCQKSASAGPPLWIRSGLYAALSPARSERHHLQKVPIRAAGGCFALRRRQEGVNRARNISFHRPRWTFSRRLAGRRATVIGKPQPLPGMCD